MEVLRETATASHVAEFCRGQVARCIDLLDRILAHEGPRTRGDTLDPLNELFSVLANAANLSGLLRSVHPDAAVRAAAEEGEREIASFAHELALNRRLYDVVRAYDVGTLDASGVRMVRHLLRDFRRSGVDRDEPIRERARSLREELVSIGQAFLRNILSDVRSITLDDPKDLQGLPDDYIRAHQPGPDGKITITTEYPDYTPFMAYSSNGELRKRLYTEFRRRAYPANLEILDRLLQKRHDLAILLGYPTWAAYATEDEMIKSPTAVAEFIDRVSTVAEPRAVAEYEVLLREKRRHEPGAAAVHDWEKAYYEELVRRSEYNIDSKEVRSYFEYSRVKDGILRLTEELFGIRFEASPSVPRWHRDVEVFDVFEDGRLVGRIYLDMHPRQGKFKHAGMFPLTRGTRNGVLPKAALVCNFPDPRKNGGIALLEHDDAVTFFHEFGHLLHHLFARDNEWVRFSGTATEWDFVEVPSQLYEEWAWDCSVLRRLTRHHVTGESIPEQIVRELRKARAFGRALWVRHQMFYAAVSLRCHGNNPENLDTNRLVEEMQNRYSLFDFVGDTYFQASFGHLDEYSALYYTYMWSLVIEKDIFGEFKKHGILSTEVAQRYRSRVLAPGGSRDAMDLVRDFLGRDYSFEAFEHWLAGGD